MFELEKRLAISQGTDQWIPPGQHFHEQNRTCKTVSFETALALYAKTLMLISVPAFARSCYGRHPFHIQALKIYQFNMLVAQNYYIISSDICVSQTICLQVP